MGPIENLNLLSRKESIKISQKVIVPSQWGM
jgi:hypothetical protein